MCKEEKCNEFESCRECKEEIELIKRSDVQAMLNELNPREFTSNLDRVYCRALEDVEEALKEIPAFKDWRLNNDNY